jgi:hypothetical protein
VGSRRKDRPTGAAKAGGRSDVALRSAICIYLIAEQRGGATIADIARLTLGGLSVLEEVPRVSDAVSQLERQGEVWMKGGKVCPVSTD